MAERPYVLSIAGIDPSGGAGLLADVKTFEQLMVNGLGIPSANTIQTENKFYANQWMPYSFLYEGMRCMLDNYPIKAVKFGIIESPAILLDLVQHIKNVNNEISIIWDPVMKSSSAFNFHKEWSLSNALIDCVDVITPNKDEWEILNNEHSSLDCAIVLKGGHNELKRGYDLLITNNREIEIAPQTADILAPKHGSGCVYSSALTAFIAKGEELETACFKAKAYTENYLASSDTLTGYHNGKTALHIAG